MVLQDRQVALDPISAYRLTNRQADDDYGDGDQRTLDGEGGGSVWS